MTVNETFKLKMKYLHIVIQISYNLQLELIYINLGNKRKKKRFNHISSRYILILQIIFRCLSIFYTRYVLCERQSVRFYVVVNSSSQVCDSPHFLI